MTERVNEGPQAWGDTSSLTHAWVRELGDTAPLGNFLRSAEPERWIRFHYLPGGERLASSPAQLAEVGRRFATVLTALAGGGTTDVVVTSCGWGPPLPAERPAGLDALLPGTHWRDVVELDPSDLPASVYATAVAVDDPALAEFLLDWVAADRTAEAIVAPASFEWLLHPYDGGMDVIARNADERERLARQFASWRSERADGL